MKKLIVLFFFIVIIFSGCALKSTVRNEEIRSARMAVVATEGLQELYEQTLLTTELMRKKGMITNEGAEYIVNLGNDAKSESEIMSTNLKLLEEDKVKTRFLEKIIQNLKNKVFKMSSAVKAFLSIEGVLKREKGGD